MPIPEYNEQAARQAVQYMRNLNDTTGGIYPPKKFGIPGPGCIATVTSAYGPQSYVTWNQDFQNNPQKYNFQEIPVDSLKAGDLFQEIDRYGDAVHAIMVDSVMPTGDLKFTYSPGSFIDLQDQENGRVNIRHLANYPIKDKETGKPLGKAYRFVGETPTKEDMKKIKEIKDYSDKQIKYYNLFKEKSRHLGTDKKTDREESKKIFRAVHENEYARPDWEAEYYNLLNAYYEPSPSKAAAGLLINQYKQGGKIPKFKELSNKDRYRIIRMGVQNGIHSVSDIEHIFDEGGHLYDGNSMLSQQLMPKKLTDYNQGDWSAIYDKQQAVNNARLAAAQAEWDKMHDEVINNPDAYDPVDVYKYIGKRPEAVQDVNRNERFENDAKVANAIGVATVATPYVAAYAPQVLTNQMVQPIAKSMMAGMGADAVSELATGKPVAEHTKDAIQFATGLNPRNNVVSNFVVDTFGNPFYGFTKENAIGLVKTNNNVLKTVDKVKSNRNFIKDINEAFPQYKEIKPSIFDWFNTEKINKYAKDRIIEDNTFIRGVKDAISQQDAEKTNQLIRDAYGIENPTVDDRLKWFATHYAPQTGAGRAGMEGLPDGFGTIYTSNSEGTAQAYAQVKHSGERYGKPVVVRRPTRFGENRNTWVNDNYVPLQNTNYLDELDYDIYRKIQEEKDKILKPIEDKWADIYNNLDKQHATINEKMSKQVHKLWDDVDNGKITSEEATKVVSKLRKERDVKIKELHEKMEKTKGDWYREVDKLKEKTTKELQEKYRKNYEEVYKDKIFTTEITEGSKENHIRLNTHYPKGTKRRSRPITRKIYDPGNNLYNHYIFVGPENEQGLEFVKFLPLNMDENFTRLHIGTSSKGLSRKRWKYGGYLLS